MIRSFSLAAAAVAGALVLTSAAPNAAQAGNGSAAAAGIIGFAAGAMVGAAASQPQYYYQAPQPYYGPQPVYYVPEPWSPAWYSYCSAKYRSFDPASGTFLGYDGRRHFCR